MTSNERRARARETIIDHVIFDAADCVYCGAPVRWRCSAAGNTRHLDHFIPVSIFARARLQLPGLYNWLLPCCPQCNGALGQCLFFTFAERTAFVGWKRNATVSLHYDALAHLSAPKALQALVRPMTEYRLDRDYIALAPFRLASGDWSIGQSAERALAGCSGKITRSATFGTVPLFSPDIG
jgi:hypothetical protein